MQRCVGLGGLLKRAKRVHLNCASQASKQTHWNQQLIHNSVKGSRASHNVLVVMSQWDRPAMPMPTAVNNGANFHCVSKPRRRAPPPPPPPTPAQTQTGQHTYQHQASEHLDTPHLSVAKLHPCLAVQEASLRAADKLQQQQKQQPTSNDMHGGNDVVHVSEDKLHDGTDGQKRIASERQSTTVAQLTPPALPPRPVSTRAKSNTDPLGKDHDNSNKIVAAFKFLKRNPDELDVEVRSVVRCYPRFTVL
jgi:hypothetical protein